MTTLIKLGGSLITQKDRPKHFRPAVVASIASQVRKIRQHQPELRLILGHGSGSFGHAEAAKHGTVHGVRADAERLGFAQVGAVATTLSQLVLAELIAAGLPAMRFQPSSFSRARNRKLEAIDASLLALALDQRLLPLVHGDIALDDAIGGTIISTEALFCALVGSLSVDEIILLGDVPGVLDRKGDVIPVITPHSYPSVVSQLGGASGFDVTGGMLQKVSTMVELLADFPRLNVVIAGGEQADILLDLLLRKRRRGTRICANV